MKHGLKIQAPTPTPKQRRSARNYALAVSVQNPDEPSLTSAMNGPFKSEFTAAIHQELQNLQKNNVLSLVPFTGQRTLPASIVLKLKRDANGDPERFKARVVAGGHRQRPGDHDLIYAPVIKPLTLFLFLTHALRTNLLVHHIDFDAAFLNAPLKEEIYMKQIPGFEESGPEFVYKLNKTLYGRKQASICLKIHSRL